MVFWFLQTRNVYLILPGKIGTQIPADPKSVFHESHCRNRRFQSFTSTMMTPAGGGSAYRLSTISTR